MTPRHRTRLRPALALTATLAAVVGTAPSALGHSAILESEPEAGARLKSGPGQITLEFTEPLDSGLSDATLINAETGERIPVKVTGPEPKQLVLQPEVRLGRAPYRVEWHTVSTVDGHALEGSFDFGVRAAPIAGEEELEQSPLARGGWLRIALRAFFYATLFFFAGGLFVTAVLSRRKPAAWLVPGHGEADGDDEAVRERAWRRTLDAGWVAAGAGAAVAVVEATDASSGLDPAGMSDFLLSNAAGLARAGAVAAIALAALHARRFPVAASAWLVLGFVAIALGGHANSAEPRALAVLTDWLHLLAAGIWIGGLAQLAVTWVPRVRAAGAAVRRALLATVLPRFGRLALPAFVVVVATGLTNALIQLGHPEELWQTAYGRVLSVKIGLVGLIAAASYLHALRLRPRLVAVNPHPPSSLERRHWRALGAEPLLAVGVVAAVAVLVAFPLPPQQLGDAGEADAGEAEAAAPCEPCPLPRASDGELAVAEQVGSRIAAFWLRREGEELRGRVRVLDKSATPVDAPIELPGGEFTGCGTGCWRLRAPAGSELAVAVEEGGDTYTASVPAEWRAGRNRAAERLLALTQSRMRGLGSVRLNERITSGPGTFVRTRYRFQAPDRIAYSTSSGSRVIGIGKTRYHAEDGGWEQQPFGAGGFQFTQLFRWTAYGQAVRWLGTERDGGRALVALALFDPASPVWYRLMVDRGSGRVIGERMIAAAHFMDRRYFAFNQPLSIEAPG